MRRDILLLGALALIGLALRIRGLPWGLPWSLHIDERLFVVAKAIHLERSLESGALPDPGTSSYGILPLWLVVLARKLFLHVTASPGPPTYGDEFAATVLLARLISAFAGASAVMLTGLWARRFGRATAYLAAAMVAGSRLVQAGHFGTVESLLVASLAAGMIAAERLAERPDLRRAAVAGVVLGLAISVKAPAALLALPIAHAAASERRGLARRLALAATCAAAAMILLDPGLLRGVDVGAATGEHTTLFGNLRRAYSGDFHDWTLPYAHDVPLWSELTKPYRTRSASFRAPRSSASSPWRAGAPRDVRLLSSPRRFLLLVVARVKIVRSGSGAAGHGRARGGRPVASARVGRRAAAGLAVAVALVVLVHGAALTAIYAEPDARVAAARWLDENLAPRETVAVEDPPGYGPPIGSPTPVIERAPLRYEILWPGFYQIYEHKTDDERRAHLLEILQDVDWLALSEGHRAEFTAAPDLRPVEAAFYRDLDTGVFPFEKVREFKSYPRLGRWTLKDDGAEVLFRVFDHPRVEVWRRRAQ